MSAELGTAFCSRTGPEAILAIDGLTVQFHGKAGPATAVDNFSATLRRGQTLGLVGESGCGKSTTAMSILRLIPERSGRIVAGSVTYMGQDMLALDDAALRAIRGNEISMIFQEPMTALNPVLTIGYQICEALVLHRAMSRAEAREAAVSMLELVQIPEPAKRIDAFPHQLSGGMRQRAMIAMALCCEPQVLIADEPTTALDVTTQAQIMDLLADLQERFSMAILLITHDLGLVAEYADRVAVMYAGRKVEEARCEDLFLRPRHPDTAGLLQAAPRIRDRMEGDKFKRLYTIPGTVPALNNLPDGCAYAPRCANAHEKCRLLRPELEDKGSDHWAACWYEPLPIEGGA